MAQASSTVEHNRNRGRPSASGADRRATIRQLNDALRCEGQGGWTMVTDGITGLPRATREKILAAVKDSDAFDPDIDPHGEHDFGAIEVDQISAFFQIDCYDSKLELGSPDPADPAVTQRVLTIMLAEEY